MKIKIWSKDRGGGSKFVLLMLAVTMLAASCNRSVSSDYNDGTVRIAGKILDIELADVPDKQAQGLSGRESIGEGQGMLFVFNQLGRPSFWMKDMNFPIDIVWIKDNIVVDITVDVPIEPQVQSDSDRKIYIPAKDANKVLEVKSGWTLRHNLKVGDEIEVKIH